MILKVIAVFMNLMRSNRLKRKTKKHILLENVNLFTAVKDNACVNPILA